MWRARVLRGAGFVALTLGFLACVPGLIVGTLAALDWYAALYAVLMGSAL